MVRDLEEGVGHRAPNALRTECVGSYRSAIDLIGHCAWYLERLDYKGEREPVDIFARCEVADGPTVKAGEEKASSRPTHARLSAVPSERRPKRHEPESEQCETRRLRHGRRA